MYWSVPRGWLPGAIALDDEQAGAVARLLARLPRSVLQDRLLEQFQNGHSHSPPAVYDEAILGILEDGATKGAVVQIRYFSASRGMVSTRHVSVHRLTYGGSARFLATCHRAGDLRWFRVDRTQYAVLAPAEPFRAQDEAAVLRFVDESLSGFRGPGEAVTYSFVVRLPESRWVVDNLPSPCAIEHLPHGIRVSARTAALTPLARFVVGLGEAAVSETKALRAEVLRLATGAQKSNATTPAIRSVRRIRATSSGRGVE